MVDTCKLSEYFDGRSVVGHSSRFSVLKHSEVDDFLVNAYLRLPTTVLMFGDSFVPRFVCSVSNAIRVILRARTWSKILSSVVEAVSVLVVHMWGVCLQYFSMHCDVTVASDVERAGVLVPCCGPVPLHQPFVVGGVNDSVLSLGKGDQSDRLIKRLDNSVSFHVAFHKEPPFLVRPFGRIAIVTQEG